MNVVLSTRAPGRSLPCRSWLAVVAVVVVVAAVVVVVVGCEPAVCEGSCASPDPQQHGAPMTPQLAADVSTARTARIYFLHHSVGANLISGVQQIDAEVGGGKLKMVPLPSSSSVRGPAVVHGPGGENTSPKSKIDSFAAAIAQQPVKPELAFMKLCYVDIDPKTDVDDLFAHYRQTLRSLARAHPSIRFAHVTVPLTTSPTSLKATLRRALGLPVWEEASNVKRHAFNARLKEEFDGDPIFDLALAESTGPDGLVQGFVVDGRTYPSLDPRYTDDGGHLNAIGERVVGAALLRFVAQAL